MWNRVRNRDAKIAVLKTTPSWRLRLSTWNVSLIIFNIFAREVRKDSRAGSNQHLIRNTHGVLQGSKAKACEPSEPHENGIFWVCKNEAWQFNREKTLTAWITTNVASNDEALAGKKWKGKILLGSNSAGIKSATESSNIYAIPRCANEMIDAKMNGFCRTMIDAASLFVHAQK